MSGTTLDWGDFVQIVGTHERQGKRGCVLEVAVDSSSCRIVLDEGSLDGDEAFQPLQIDLALENIRVIHKHAKTNILNVDFYREQSFPVHGIAASVTRPFRESLVDPSSAHGRVPRPPIQDLPPPHSEESLFIDNSIEALYRGAYSGRFRLGWKHEFASPETICMASPSISIFVCATHEDEETDTKLAGCRICFQSDYSGNRDVEIKVHFAVRTHAKISLQQAQALIERAIQISLRLFGYDMGAYKYSLHCWIKKAYASKGWWKESLDLETIQADLAVEMQRSNSDIVLCLENLSDALGVSKSFLLAAEVLEHAAPRSSWSIMARVQVHIRQAHWYTGAGKFDAAGNAMILAFQQAATHYKGRVVDSELAQQLLQLAKLYYAVQAHEDNQAFGAKWTTTKTMSYLLRLIHDVIHGTAPGSVSYPKGLLDKKLQRPKVASRALSEAIHVTSTQTSYSSAIEAFQAKVHSWIRPSRRIEEEKVDHSQFFAFSLSDYRGSCGENVRSHQRDSAQEDVLLRCSNIGCGVSSCSMQVCIKCKEAPYCSRECQVAHWKLHRPLCKMMARTREAAAAGTTTQEG